MSITRKIKELIKGRVLIKTDEHNISLPLLADLSFRKLCSELGLNKYEYLTDYVFNGGYKFSGVNHNYKDSSISTWLTNIKKDYSASFTNTSSYEIIAEIDEIVPKLMAKGTDKSRFVHEVYANVSKEKHYLDLMFQYTFNYTVNVSDNILNRTSEEQRAAKLFFRGFMNWDVKK